MLVVKYNVVQIFKGWKTGSKKLYCFYMPRETMQYFKHWNACFYRKSKCPEVLTKELNLGESKRYGLHRPKSWFKPEEVHNFALYIYISYTGNVQWFDNHNMNRPSIYLSMKYVILIQCIENHLCRLLNRQNVKWSTFRRFLHLLPKSIPERVQKLVILSCSVCLIISWNIGLTTWNPR